MSVQLILYPQSYNGTYTYTSAPVLNQYVAAGNFITGINSNTATSNSQPSNNAVTTSTPISAWKSFNSTGGTFASCTAPSVSGQGLTLRSSGSGTSSTGVYQLIPNLIVGQCYELKITISSGSATGTLYLGNTFNVTWSSGSNNFSNLGGVGAAGQFWNTTTGVAAANFIFAQNTAEVLLLDYRNNDGSNIIISDISLTECPATAPTLPVDLADGQVICDLYEDESIPLSLSIDDFKNVAERTQSYSKDFHLPNTKRNKKIFGHIFEVTRSTDSFSFNPYIKTKSILKEDGYTLFEGFLKLIDINDKESEISYNVNMYSESVTLKDILDTREFSDIDFTELQHDYTITNIKNSWDDSTGLDLSQNLTTSSLAYQAATGLGNTNVIKYPYVNWRGDWTLDPNVNATSGFVNDILIDDLEQIFRPFIQIKYLIDRIISEAGFEYTSTFLNTTDFKKLFMDFNWGQGLGSSEVFENFTVQNKWDGGSGNVRVWAGTGWTMLELGDPISETPTGIAATYMTHVTGNKIVATNDNTTINILTQQYLYNSEPSVAHTVEARWVHANASGTVLGTHLHHTATIGTTTGAFPQKKIWSGWWSVVMNTGDTLTAYFKADESNKVFQGNNQTYSFGGSVGSWFTVRGENVFQLTSIQTAASSLLHAIRGDMGQWEFLKGIFTMFNLVAVQEDDLLTIEPYADIFINNSNSTQIDWTYKVDISEINLKPLELKKRVKFTYEDDDGDYSLNVYKKATGGYLYGSKIYDASGFTLLTDEEEIVATPFAPTLMRPATDLFDIGLTIPNIYTGNEDGTQFEDYENKPRILYNIGEVTLSTNMYHVPAQNGVAATSLGTFLQFAHISEIPTTITTPSIDYNFGECQLIPPVGGSPSNNLYNTYHSPYYDELYHSDTRVMTLKVNLSPADIQNFRFYNKVLIKNREYRVNKIEYKPNTLAKVEFILIP